MAKGGLALRHIPPNYNLEVVIEPINLGSTITQHTSPTNSVPFNVIESATCICIPSSPTYKSVEVLFLNTDSSSF